MAATYWIGQDGNIYYGSGETGAPVQNLGNATTGQFETRDDGLYDRYTDNGTPSLTYGASRINDPMGGGNVLSEVTNTSNARTAAPNRDMLDEQAYWDDQLGNADQQLGRLPGQEATLRANAQSAYQSAYERLVGDKNKTKRDYDTTRGKTVEDNISAKGEIDTSVRNRNSGLQRLLGARGAGNSSAARILAPFAAAQEGSAQRGQVQKAYGRNIQGLDTAWGDYEDDWKESEGDLGVQRDNAITQGVAGLRQTEADLTEAKSNGAVQRAMAGGANYTQARAQRTPYTQRIQELIGQIDSAGATKNFTPKSAAYKAPELSSYTYDRYAAPGANSGVNPNAAQQSGAYWTLLGKDEEKKR